MCFFKKRQQFLAISQRPMKLNPEYYFNFLLFRKINCLDWWNVTSLKLLGKILLSGHHIVY